MIWLMLAMTPFFINSLMISTAETFSVSASSLTLRARGSCTSLFSTTKATSPLLHSHHVVQTSGVEIRHVFSQAQLLVRRETRFQRRVQPPSANRLLPALALMTEVGAPARLLARWVYLDAARAPHDAHEVSLVARGAA